MLENEQIGRAFARQADHVLIVILDPPAHGLPIHQLHADLLLLLTQSLEKAGFFKSLFRRRGPPALAGVGVSLRTERHDGNCTRSALDRDAGAFDYKLFMSQNKNTSPYRGWCLTFLVSVRLEDDLQAELRLTRRTQRIHAGADADPVYQLSGIVGAVDATGATGQQP
jgi:hypothetical protein